MKISKLTARAGILIGTMLVIALVSGVFLSAFAQTDHLPPSAYPADYICPPAPEGKVLLDCFDVGGHGPKSWPLPVGSVCPVDVMCVNSEGMWVTNTVKDVSCADGVAAFVSEQHGTCGLFAASAGGLDAPVIGE
jgi:hypothetical protein